MKSDPTEQEIKLILINSTKNFEITKQKKNDALEIFHLQNF